jgi:hypothetical protein
MAASTFSDIAIIETLNGGDLKLRGNDLAVQGGWGNMPYLGWFGGNIEGSTKPKLNEEESADWWGNNILFPQDSSVQFNSELERALRDTELTSFGRMKLQQAAQKDLSFMSAFSEISVIVSILSDDRVEIKANVRKPSTINGRVADQYRQYIYIWDAYNGFGDFSAQDFNDDFNI